MVLPSNASDPRRREESLKERTQQLPVWKQVVTDDQGRRRFHGAFTGGFSAGFFNTVGSKEGWTPKNFSSSRESRATPRQTAEDFMDEEDLASGLGASLKARAEFGIFGGGGGGGGGGEGSFTRAAEPNSLEQAMSQMLERVPDEKNVGLRLMRVMGWKDGTGCGAMIRRAPVHQTPRREEDGSSPPAKRRVVGPALSRTEIDEIRFAPMAPRDVGVARFANKDDTHGLGYDPFSAAPEFASARAKSRGAKQSAPARVAFGFGTIEEPDGLDPFAVDDMSAYDSSLMGTLSTRGAPVNESKRCSDGRPPLPGFVLGQVWEDSVESIASQVVLPANWKPKPPVVDSLLASGVSSQALTQWAVLAAHRAVRVKLERDVKQEEQPTQFESIAPASTKMMEDAGNMAAFSSTLPFSQDPVKQHRYQNWLLSENGLASVWKNVEPPSASEIEEFKAAKQQWSAVPAGMTDRFAPSGHVVDVKSETQVDVEEFRKFGPGTTRSEEDWAPSSLLCRRWGVKDPFADGQRSRPDGNAQKSNVERDLFPALTRELEKQFGAAYKAQMAVAEAEAAQRAEEAAKRAQMQHPGEQIEPQVRPTQDVFRAIFDTQSLIVAAEGISSEPETVQVKKESETRADSSISPGHRDLVSSIFGGSANDAAPVLTHRSRTLELLERAPILQSWVSSEIEGSNKKEKKKKEKKKKKKKKDKDKDKKTKTKKDKKTKKRKEDDDEFFHF